VLLLVSPGLAIVFSYLFQQVEVVEDPMWILYITYDIHNFDWEMLNHP